MMVCVPDETRCPTPGEPAVERCRPDGAAWTADVCPDGGRCVGGGCVPDPAECLPGDRICLADGRPAECVDAQWVPRAACADEAVCADGACLSPDCALAARARGSRGCEFFAADLPNLGLAADGGEASTRDAPWAVVVVNDGARAARVSVLGPDGPAPLVGEMQVALPPLPPEILENIEAHTVRSHVRDGAGQIIAEAFEQAADLEVPAGGVATFLFARDMASSRTSSVTPNAVRIVSDAPLAAQQFSPYCCNYSFSTEASLLLPTSAWGRRHRWLGVPGGGPIVAQNAMVAVIGAGEATEVRLTPPAGVSVSVRVDDERLAPIEDGYVAELGAHEVLLLHSGAPAAGARPVDLSGTLVESSRPVAVFSAHVCANYPGELAACDHLQEQLAPIADWGDRFDLVPTRLRGQSPRELTYWKLMAGDAPATITFGAPLAEIEAAAPGYDEVLPCRALAAGGDMVVLQPGGVCGFGSRAALTIAATAPIQVLGIISGHESTGLPAEAQAGDPSIFLVPATAQYRADHAFAVPDTVAGAYATIITTPGNALRLDGAPLVIAEAEPVAGGERIYAHIPLDAGAHTLTAAEPFGLVVYVYESYVSYAFPGGLGGVGADAPRE